MTEHDFKLIYTRMCANYGKNMNTEAIQIKGDMLFERYNSTPTETFKNTIDLVMEKHGAVYGFFPSIKEISGCMSTAIMGNGGEGKKYPPCPVCNKNYDGVGAISMIFEMGEIERGTKKCVKKRHVWTFELQRTINTPNCYDYNVACRCEAGQAWLTRRKGNTYQLTEEEYNGLLKEAKKPKAEGTQTVIPF